MAATHAAAVRHVRRTAVRNVDGRFDVVVSTNGGYPLDRNLYQAVKGMAAAARVASTGATNVMAAECTDGVPDGSEFAALLAEGGDLVDPSRPKRLEGWQAQVLGRVLRNSHVDLFAAGLSDRTIRGSGMRLVPDIQRAIDDALARAGRDARVCVLPEGPLTVAVAD
jgi:nickel-dependent lactate racemase